ncbi:MAG: hypothetical protein ABIO51_05060 [Solirubrobacteraceae bacterium]
MPRFALTLLSAALLTGLAVPAADARTPVAVGLGDQSPRMFDAKAFKALKIKKVRYFIRWDGMRIGYARRGADEFMAAARKAGVKVFMHFSTNDFRKRKAKLPSLRQYKRYVGNLIKRYKKMGVREFGVWNEANHYTQPTYKNPRRAAQYYKIARKVCGRTCKIVALDVLDQPGVESYIRRFYRALSPAYRRRANLVGIHNYGDTNRFRVSGTRDIIRAVRKQNRLAKFWFTETGGIVNLGSSFKCSTTRAARAVNYMFKLARKYRRSVSRLYAYNWFGTKPSCTGFDSGLVAHNGKLRKGYRVFKREARGFAR